MEHVQALLHDVQAATERLLSTARGLTDERLRAPCALPGWSRGHLISHLCRNADGLVNLLTWARTGVRTPQYPSPEAREHDIETGAGRDAALQLADLRESAARFATAVRTMPAQAWSARVAAFGGEEHAAWVTLVRRWCEVEIHHVDLDTGYLPADWPRGFVDTALDRAVNWWAAADPAPMAVLYDTTSGREWRFGGQAQGPSVAGPGHVVLAWLTGRGAGTGLDVMPAGPLPTPPAWS